jgi:HD-GYP domain-containing protein (c-di-GMP phosphodiesterase class II)
MSEASDPSSFIKIRISSISPLMPVPFDIYVLVNSKFVHYLRAGDSLTYEKIRNLDAKAQDVFCIHGSQRELYRQYISTLLNSETLNTQQKANVLRESSLAIVEDLFETANVAEALEEAKGIVGELVEFIESTPDGLEHLIGLSSHDFYTYNHSLDVSIYSMGLGQLAGFSGRELKELGEGGLFHDIGKRYIDVGIITKTGPLTDDEWEQMKKHPQYGLYILDKNSLSENIKACCFEHHESFLGNGYPQELGASEIHPMARIVAICDTYDALTTKRSYSSAMHPHQAMDLMTQKLAERFDPALLKAMLEVMLKK